MFSTVFHVHWIPVSVMPNSHVERRLQPQNSKHKLGPFRKNSKWEESKYIQIHMISYITNGFKGAQMVPSSSTTNGTSSRALLGVLEDQPTSPAKHTHRSRHSTP